MRLRRHHVIGAVVLVVVGLLIAAGFGVFAGEKLAQSHYKVTLPSGVTVTQAHSPEFAQPKPGQQLPAQIVPTPPPPQVRAKDHVVQAPVVSHRGRLIPAHKAARGPPIHASGDPTVATVEQWDSVTISTIPSFAHYVAGYVDGNYQTYRQMLGRFPFVVGISVSTRHGADCFDMEPGNPGPENAGPWARQQIKDGNTRPCEYSMLSWMGAIRANLAAYGVPHCSSSTQSNCYVLWDANWTYYAHLDVGYDCTQWTDHAYGRNLDESTCLTSFYLRKGARSGPTPTQIRSWASARAASIAAYRHGPHLGYSCHQPVLTTGFCGQEGWRVNHYQVLLDPTNKTKVVCFGPRAQPKAAVCQIVRPAVATYSRARDSAKGAFFAKHCVPVPPIGGVCKRFYGQETYFQGRINQMLSTSRLKA